MSENQLPYVKPGAVEEACTILFEHGPDAKVVAGGQSLSLLLRQDLLDPAVIVDISELSELVGVHRSDGRVRIGATTTYSAIETAEAARQQGAIADAVEVIGDPQVRNLGTIGGAISHADPSLDILPPLLSLDASLVIAGPEGERSVDFREFYTGYMETDLKAGEIVAAVTIDAPPVTAGSAYEKYSSVHGGWATTGVASALELDGEERVVETARIALSAVDDTPVRAPSAEEFLEGKEPTAERIGAAAERIPADINPLEDLSGSIPYKESLGVRLGRRSLSRARERATGGESR